MHGSSWRRIGAIGAVGVAVMILVAACGGGGASATPTPAPTPTAAPTAASTPTAAPAAASASPTVAPGGVATLDAPATVAAGAAISVTWTGPNTQGDYVAIMASGAGKWTNEPYFYTNSASPATLVAPTAAGDYELRYIAKDETVLARRPITVTAFVGTLDAVDSVAAGTTFEVTWTGSNGPKDYVTIMPTGAANWSGEPYFYTADANPGKLVAPMTAGAFELRYIAGADSKTMVSRPIAVTPLQIALEAPPAVDKDSTFAVKWTGPNGPGDYVTIVPAGSPAGTYASYAYTANGSPATLTAPGTAGPYEIWYASDRAPGIFKSIPIIVR